MIQKKMSKQLHRMEQIAKLPIGVTFKELETHVVNILKEGKTPGAIFHRGNADRDVKHILIYNQYLGSHHSFILLASC